METALIGWWLGSFSECVRGLEPARNPLVCATGYGTKFSLCCTCLHLNVSFAAVMGSICRQAGLLPDPRWWVGDGDGLIPSTTYLAWAT